ncbi:MAG: sensor histidine kinase N-terminal domain-containing protein [Betaproteobacteria bacterium]|nr:sensor histidine kinase N-terminal domain-containing protein [Betaproteobacteria bacterium]
MSTITSERPVTPQPEKATLRHQLLISLLAPIVLVTLMSSVVSYYYAFNFATLAYDYSLFDSALDIGRQVRYSEDQLRVDLPHAALDMLESDKHDRIFYMVSDAKGAFIAGHRGLPLPPEDAAPGKPVYYDGNYRGSQVRIAALYSLITGAPGQDPVLILVGETLNKRRTLANEVLLGMLLPELLLIVLLSVLIWYGIERGLRPLAALQKEISSRSHRDLSPLPEQNAPGEVRSLVRAMNDLLARLSEVLSAQQRFITDAAHQLRTPLAGLKTQTELALRQQELDEVRHTLQQLNTATGQTTHLVNQLLSLARAEPGANRTQVLHPVNINDLAREITTEWVPRAIERSIDLGFDGASNAANIEGDALLIREMLRNLLDNAIRYTQRGGQVTVRVAAERDQALLSVEDDGPGIPPGERERVFERFHRGLGTGAEGCGLGLAIVREIAQSHNADIRLGPGANGSGTLVTVAFPRAA